MTTLTRMQCQYCGGTLGTTEYIDRAPLVNSEISKFTEVWFHCLYCASNADPAETLISVITE